MIFFIYMIEYRNMLKSIVATFMCEKKNNKK